MLSSAVVSTLLFYLIAPKYLDSDGNRFLGISYQFLGIGLSLGIVSALEFLYLKKKMILLTVSLFIVAWILIPSSLPQTVVFAQIHYNQDFFFQPSYLESPPITKWIDSNIPIPERVLDLAGFISHLTDNYRYYGLSQPVLPYAGVLTPYWDGKYRAYMYAAGPDYLDILYTLNPTSLKKLKLSYLVIDKQYFDNLPKIRQDQLNDKNLFTQSFIDDYPLMNYWIAVYKINERYLEEAEDIPETSDYLEKVIPQKADIFIEKDFAQPYSWLQIRNAIVLVLKDRTLWLYNVGAGGYGYLSTTIPYKLQTPGQKYDYLILKKETDPKTVCDCLFQQIWKGFNNKVVVWKVVQN